MTGSPRELFVSYNRDDSETVIRISGLLEAQGIPTFLDQRDFPVGLPWSEQAELALSHVSAVAVFLGGSGLGPWQKREIGLALDRQVRAEAAGDRFRVIPVLLPGGDPGDSFLFHNTWVDLRSDPNNPEALRRLVDAARDAAPSHPEESAGLCPYRGLSPYGEEDAVFFCGREEFSDRLLEAVLAWPFVAVVGRSGSGKSSVVQAGLLPRLRRQRPPDATWEALSFTPGERPYHRLAFSLVQILEPGLSELDRLSKASRLGNEMSDGTLRLEDALSLLLQRSGRLLLVVDQFEELFTQTPEADRKPFVERLLGLTERLSVTVALTLRADFYDHALALSRDLSDRLEGSVVNLGPMRRDELARAIEQPAGLVGLALEPGLVNRILDDVGDEPGNLPLLEFALTELWKRRSGRNLTNAAYEASGRVAGAIAQRAEAEFGKLDPERQGAARRAFLELVRVAPAEEGNRDTRRRARLEDLDAAAQEMVKTLAGPEARLLVTGRDEEGNRVVEVTHEALIQSWERLRKWLEENREFLVWRERFKAYLLDYRQNRTLLSGAPLLDAKRWLRVQRTNLSPDAIAFIEASVRFRGTTRLYRSLLVLIVVGVVTLAGWLARRQAAENRANAIFASNVPAQDPGLAALLALEIDRSAPSSLKESLDAVRFAQQAAVNPLPRTVLYGAGGGVGDIAFSPDGLRFITATNDGARIWNTDGSGEHIHILSQGLINNVDFSPDGSRVLIASYDSVKVLNDNGTIFANVPVDEVMEAAFNLDGSQVLTVDLHGSIEAWELDGSRGKALAKGVKNSVKDVSFSHDRKRVMVIDVEGIARLYNADSSSEPITLPEPEQGSWLAAIRSSDSKVLISQSDGSLRVQRVDSRDASLVPEVGSVQRAVFSPDQLRVLTLHEQVARVWHIGSSGGPITLRGETPVQSAAWSPRGKIVTGHVDGTLRVWDLDAPSEPLVLAGHDTALRSATFSSDGSRAVTVSGSGAFYVWDLKKDRPSVVLSRRLESPAVAALNSDGSRVFTFSGDNIARVWSTDKPDEPQILHSFPFAVDATASGDGLHFASASEGTVWVWNAADKPVIVNRGKDEIGKIKLNWSGSHIVIAFLNGRLQIQSVGEPHKPFFLEGVSSPSRIARFALSPDGSRVLISFPDGAVRLLSLRSGKPIFLGRHSITGSEVPEGDAMFSRDGLKVVIPHYSVAEIWNTRVPGEPLVLRGSLSRVASAAFSHDGSRIITTSNDGTARIWRVSWESLIEYLRSTIDSCLTPEQRLRYLAEEESEAREAYEACERAHGREPAQSSRPIP